jgi:hypothetical protein
VKTNAEIRFAWITDLDDTGDMDDGGYDHGGARHYMDRGDGVSAEDVAAAEAAAAMMDAQTPRANSAGYLLHNIASQAAAAARMMPGGEDEDPGDVDDLGHDGDVVGGVDVSETLTRAERQSVNDATLEVKALFDSENDKGAITDEYLLSLPKICECGVAVLSFFSPRFFNFFRC